LIDEEFPRAKMSWQRPTALMSAIVAFLAGSAIQSVAQPTVVDRPSGVAFPAVLIPPGGGLAHQLTGTATRERTVFRMKVYAYGLYVGPMAAWGPVIVSNAALNCARSLGLLRRHEAFQLFVPVLDEHHL
jgi:hypothetical protein